MNPLDKLFPKREDCFFSLFRDAVFEHNDKYGYEFEHGKFKRRDRNAGLKEIMAIADIIYAEKIAAKFTLCEPYTDYIALLGVFTRYSRDIYGFRRMSCKLREMTKDLDPAKQEELVNEIINEGADFGFLVPSSRPYIHRQAAVLLYWFSVLKPFSLTIKKGEGTIPDKNIIAYFNEYFAYSLICAGLHAMSVDITLHKNKDYFIEFLNQLHFRSLSRSSLEFFLPSWIEKPKP